MPAFWAASNIVVPSPAFTSLPSIRIRNSLIFFSLSDDCPGCLWDRSRHRRTGNLLYRLKTGRADLVTSPALGTFHLLNDVDPVFTAINGLGRALSKAYHTGLALIRVNMISDQLFAGKSRAPLLPDVGLILISKIL